MAWQFYGIDIDCRGFSCKARGELYGPFAKRRWAKHPSDKRHKLARKATGPRPFPPNAKLQAVTYAEWLAARDGIALPETGRRCVLWSQVWLESRKSDRRIRAVMFGNVEIELPNWDWQPVMTEEHETELQLAA